MYQKKKKHPISQKSKAINKSGPHHSRKMKRLMRIVKSLKSRASESVEEAKDETSTPYTEADYKQHAELALTEADSDEVQRVVSQDKGAKEFCRILKEKAGSTARPSLDPSSDSYLPPMLCIALYRLRVALLRKDVKPTNKAIAATQMYRSLGELASITEPDKKRFFCTLIFHCSRGFIDPDEEAIRRAGDILNGNEAAEVLTLNRVNPSTMNVETVAAAFDILKKIYRSRRFREGCTQFCREYSIPIVSVDQCIEYVAANLNNVVWVKEGHFYGMCGMKNVIYLGLKEPKMFSNLQGFTRSEIIEIQKAYIVSTKLHEDAHEILRAFKGDFCSMTQENEVTHEILEGGYRMEKILFGAVVSLPEKARELLNIESWDQADLLVPLFSAETIKEMALAYDGLNIRCSGIRDLTNRTIRKCIQHVFAIIGLPFFFIE
eukprot:TRINITY_DN122085_c0_g1_i1.p1 TRINITY_DN122085_c0_g1~~TRINITY_DN122085_c0_g1_i1.p1  ORF type:complete len:435 (-),score=21.34 TRINITY_DN122085_c0_g1_i1:112-1416(-)